MEFDKLTNRKVENQKEITWEEVSQHNNPQDLWIVIENLVYSVSSYADEHPGGPIVLQNRGGKDATKQFLDAGHTDEARKNMKQYLIGKIKPGDIPLPGQFDPEFKLKKIHIAIFIILCIMIGLFIVFKS